MQTTNTTITFNRPGSNPDNPNADRINVTEDSDYSGVFQGKVFLVTGSSQVTAKSDTGTISKMATGIPSTVQETLSFADAKEAMLQALPTGTVSVVYSSCGTPAFDGKRVYFPGTKFGIVQVEYQTLSERWGFEFDFPYCIGGNPPSAFVVFACGSASHSEVIENWHCSSQTVQIRVVNACTGDPVANASVMVDGSPAGDTDADGLLTLTGLTTGDHPVIITAAGYVPSDSDVLDNDNLAVSEDS